MAAFSIMVPVNWTNHTLEHSNLTYSDIDKLSISNIPNGSSRYVRLSVPTLGRYCFLFLVFFSNTIFLPQFYCFFSLKKISFPVNDNMILSLCMSRTFFFCLVTHYPFLLPCLYLLLGAAQFFFFFYCGRYHLMLQISLFDRFWTHLVMAYVFTLWTCYVLKKEYEIIASMRLHFLASEQRRPDQFTVRWVF